MENGCYAYAKRLDPTCLPLRLPFPIKNKNFKVVNSRQHLDLFIQNYQACKVFMSNFSGLPLDHEFTVFDHDDDGNTDGFSPAKPKPLLTL